MSKFLSAIATAGLIGLLTGGGSGLLKGAAPGAGGLVSALLDPGSHQVERGSPLTLKLLDPIQVG